MQASTPLPTYALKSVVSATSTPSSLAFSIMALAIGCSAFASRDTAILSTSRSVRPWETMSVTPSSPLVSVPVLSKAMALVLLTCSKYALPLTRTPFLPALVIAETMATGVDMARAHGQATTSITRAL